MAGIGPAPKPASKRRRANKPATYGAATPTTTTPAASRQDRVLGIDDPHPLVADMWAALQISCESRFYSEADWQRVRMELWNANTVIAHPTASTWQQVQCGLNAMLISPAEKRRCAIEVKPLGPDADEDAAVLQIAKYQKTLKPE